MQRKEYESHSRKDCVTGRILVTTKTEYGWWNIFSRTREHHNHPQTIWTVIASAPNRYRSFSRERTHLDLEDPNGVSEWDIGLPTQLSKRRRSSTWLEKFLWLHMSQESLDSSVSAYCSLWRVQYVQKSLPQDNHLRPTPSGHPFRIIPETDLTGSCTRTPKYSCKDC